jgi:hypothetical protein
MKRSLSTALGLLIGATNVVHAADLPSHKADPCYCKLHIERPDVFVNGQAPRGPYVSSNAVEGTRVSAADAGIKTASLPSNSGWLAHFAEALPGLYSGDRITLVNGGQAHLSWPDGSYYQLTEPVTTIGPELCRAATAPVVAFAPGIGPVVALAALAAVGVGIGVGVGGNPPPPPFIPPILQRPPSGQ